MNIGVGIDFGNTNTSISVRVGNKTYWPISKKGYISSNVLKDDKYIGFRDLHKLNYKIGISRIKRIINNYPNLIQFDDIVYKIEDNVVLIQEQDEWICLKTILKNIFKQMQEIINKFLKNINVKNIGSTIITVPAHYIHLQKQFLLEAVKDVVSNPLILNEPIAAAISGLKFNFKSNNKNSNLYLIYDLGGSTLDITLANLNNTLDCYEILDCFGTDEVGGDTFSYIVGNIIINSLKLQASDLVPVDLNYFFKKCENYKEDLTSKETIKTNLKNLKPVSISKKQFNHIALNFKDNFINPINIILKRNQISCDDIDKVFIVGGASRTPILRNWFKELFPNEKLMFSNNPEKVISSGASLFSQESINKVMSNFINNNIGIEIFDGTIYPIFFKNSEFPLEKVKTFSTHQNNQKGFTIQLYEGDSLLAKDNKKISEFSIDDLPEAPAKSIKIVLKFSVDVNGILNVVLIDIINDLKNKSNSNT